jgi:hypothetical protein
MIPQAHSPSHRRPPFWRRKRLVKPSLQLKLIVTFGALFGSVFLLQILLLQWQVDGLGLDSKSPVPADVILLAVERMHWIAVLVCLPLTLLVGVLTTFRLVGPIHRFETYLGAIARGEDPGPCKIRVGDELHDLCDQINAAVTTLRARSTQPAAPSSEGETRVDRAA